MQPYQVIDDATWIHGGVRSLIELAAGLAAIDIDVELRGSFADAEVRTIERAAGVHLGRPGARRRPQPDELVIIPEAHDDPLIFARVALSGARAVMIMLGPVGMFGWPFDGTPVPSAAEVVGVDPDTVGRPASLAAARSFGLELWTNAPAIGERAASAGIEVKCVGAGRPAPYPEPAVKSVDVLALAENRWAPLAMEALQGIPSRFETRVQLRATHSELLAALSAARVFIHPARIEGRSRLCEEARAMRAVPVLLASNCNGEGYGPEYGSVVVDSVAEMAAAAVALLDDPDRLATLAENGYLTARHESDWETYKRSLLQVVARPDAVVAAGASARSQVGQRIVEEQARLLRRLGDLERERDDLAADAESLREQTESLRERMAALWVQFDEASERVDELNAGLVGTLSSSSWRITKPLRATMDVIRALRRKAGA
jgi:hypothetical protein